MTNKYVIDDILKAVVAEKPVDLQAALNSIMLDKAHDQISAMKVQLAQDMFGSKSANDEVEEVEDEPEDDAEVPSDEIEELDADDLLNNSETDEEETSNQG